MKHRFLIFSLVLLYAFSLSAQKIGLVLSGGGAKGITHIGMIKALEENNIPIDFVAGTSIGAIVASLYAMGMTPEEMVAVLKSDSFHRWSTGELRTNEKYFYFNPDPRPSFLDLRFNFRIESLDSIDVKANVIPANFVSPNQMNLAFMDLYAQAAAAADYDFDHLFVPFRCVASDIYRKEPVVFSNGNLGDAVRASMTFPMMYRPIEIEGRLMFDGGIFNNFPVDVMLQDFHPDYIIGSVVAENPEAPQKNDIISQLMNLVMNRTNYDIPEKEGVVLKYNLEKYNMFDFSKVDEMVKTGYDSTMAKIAQIKQTVKRQTDSLSLAKKRTAFKKKFPELSFQKIEIYGVDSLQEIYIRQFMSTDNNKLSFANFRRKYFMLLSDSRIQEIIPQAKYNPKNKNFDLMLKVDVEAPVIAHVGGNISSSTSNQAYFGVTFQKLSNYALSANMDAQFGKIYNFIGLSGRIDVPSSTPFYINLSTIFHRFSFFEKSKWFYEDNTKFDFDQNELFAKLSLGLPVGMRGKFEGGLGTGLLTDHYRLFARTSIRDTRNDESSYSLYSTFLRYENYTLNNMTFPTSGYKYNLAAQLLNGKENFKPSTGENVTYSSKDTWLQFHGQYENYINISRRFIFGAYAEAVFSTRKFLSNYTATIVQAPAFAPTAHSKTIFNETFHTNKFAAVGIKPIFKLNNQLYLRTEAYWFLPFQKIEINDERKAYYKEFSFKSSEYIAEASFVFNLKRVSIAFFSNHYSTAKSRWNLGLNIGFLMFNNKFVY